MQSDVKQGMGLGTFFLRAMAMLGTLLGVVAVTLFLSLDMLCSNAFPYVQQTFVTTILETGQLKFLASWFLPAEEIQEIVNQNSMKELKAEINANLIQTSGKTASIDIQMDTVAAEVVDEEAIEILEVAGATFTGTMMIVKDPSTISLATIYPWREKGVTLDELVNSNGAIAGINGGLYKSNNNTGGEPSGVLVSNGKILYNKPREYAGLVLVGFTEDDILQIIDVSKMSSSEVETMIKDMKIRDAVCFQEEASDANNHFVQLIINGEAREMNGMGSGLNPRTAIGQRADGAVLLFVTDGRGKSGHLGASSSDLIAVMQEFGAVNAANLDGGSSSCMYYEGEYLMSSVTFYYANSSWRLPAAFIIKSP